MLDFRLTDEQQRNVATWHAFAEDVMRPAAAEHDRAESTPMDVLEEAAQRGIYSLDFWAAGREDPTGLHWLLATEELFWGCAGIGLQLTVSGLALAGLSSAGTPEQLVQWAPECFGSPGDIKLGALAVTEPDGGSDICSLQTTARRDGSDWVLDGHKMFIGNGGIADVHIVVATVDPDLGHRGQASFVVPKGTHSLIPVRRLSKLGLRAAYTGEFRPPARRAGQARTEARRRATRTRAPAPRRSGPSSGRVRSWRRRPSASRVLPTSTPSSTPRSGTRSGAP